MIAQLIAPYLMGRFGHTGPNQPAALNPAGASSSDSGHRWRRGGEPSRWAEGTRRY